MPPLLLRATPRGVRLNAAGAAIAILCAALAIGGLWAGAELYRRALRSVRQVALFQTEAVTTQAEIVRVRYHDRNRRATITYRSVADGMSYVGVATVRPGHGDRDSSGSAVEVVHLSSDPSESWLQGRGPSRQPLWPAFAIPAAALIGTALLAALIRRQINLLSYGRGASATVTKVAQKSDKTHWLVEYEWKVLSGATRHGRYHHNRKKPPAVGAVFPIVYDRDAPQRHMRYPPPLVRLQSRS